MICELCKLKYVQYRTYNQPRRLSLYNTTAAASSLSAQPLVRLKLSKPKTYKYQNQRPAINHAPNPNTPSTKSSTLHPATDYTSTVPASAKTLHFPFMYNTGEKVAQGRL